MSNLSEDSFDWAFSLLDKFSIAELYCEQVDRPDYFPENEIWLDNLPIDINHRICDFVSGGRPVDDALCLAKSSKAQRYVVASGLKFSLRDWTSVDDDRHAEWKKDCQLTNDSMLEDNINLEHKEALIMKHGERRERVRQHWVVVMKPFIEHIQGEFPEFLESRNLKSISITSLCIEVHDTLFRLNKNDFVPKIELNVHDVEPDEDSVFPFLPFTCLPLRKLAVHGHIEDDFLAIGETANYFSKSLGYSLAGYCPLLEELELDCRRLSSEVLWKTLPEFSLLKRLHMYNFQGDIPEAALKWMRTLSCINLTPWPSEYVSLTDPLFSTSTDFISKRALSARDVSNLQSANLRNLEIMCQEGLEVSLQSSMDSFQALRSLSLSWPPSGAYETRKCDLYNEQYYAIKRNVMLRLVSGLPHLEELRIKRARIEFEELNSILMCIGNRLLVFESPISGQDESGLDRLEGVLKALTRYNVALRHYYFGKEPDGYGSLYGFDQHVRRQCLKIQERITFLQRRAPFLKTTNLYQFIDFILSCGI